MSEAKSYAEEIVELTKKNERLFLETLNELAEAKVKIKAFQEKQENLFRDLRTSHGRCIELGNMLMQTNRTACIRRMFVEVLPHQERNDKPTVPSEAAIRLQTRLDAEEFVEKIDALYEDPSAINQLKVLLLQWVVNHSPIRKDLHARLPEFADALADNAVTNEGTHGWRMSGIRLVGVHVEGFRAFQRQFKASFRSPRGEPSDVLVIAGPNGTGKSTLLEAILLCMGKESLIQRSLIADVAPGHWRTLIPDTATIALTFDIRAAPGTELGPYAPCEVRLFRTSSAWRLELLRDGHARPLQDPIRESFLRDMVVEYLSSWRGSFQLGGVRPSSTNTDGPQDERYRFYRMKQRIIDERSARGFSGRETRDSVWLNRLNEVWRSWHDGPDTWIDALETGDPDRPFDLFLVRDVGYGAQPVCPLDMASSGELEWVTLAGSLIIDDFQGLLLIDEPELHLHPQWQARLLPTLRKLAPDAQLIVATHSAFPWDQALPFQRLLLLPDGDPRANTDDEPQPDPVKQEVGE